MANWKQLLKDAQQNQIKDPSRIAHLTRMVKLQEEHGGKECICTPNEPCDYHAATTHSLLKGGRT